MIGNLNNILIAYRRYRQTHTIGAIKMCKSIRLYKAADFPLKWSFVSTLLYGKKFSDSSIFHYQDYWWMFTAEGKGRLRLYLSSALKGPWKEHPLSPIIDNNPNIARPAGRVLVTEGAS